jgi:hypothetical protein
VIAGIEGVHKTQRQDLSNTFISSSLIMGIENLVIILRLLSVEEVINTGRLELRQTLDIF